MMDYRTDGPPEAQRLARERPACQTAPNGTGSRCSCGFSCANYWLRANGFTAESPLPEAVPVTVASPVRRWWWPW